MASVRCGQFPILQKPALGSEIEWAHPLSRGLVGCWLLNEGAGKIGRDTAKGNHGLLTNFAATITSGWIPTGRGMALICDGINDYLDCGIGEDLNPTQALTVLAWFSTTNSATKGLFSNIGVNPYPGYVLGTGFGDGGGASAGVLSFYTKGGGWKSALQRVDSGAVICGAATNDSTNTNFYINGALVRTVAQGGSTSNSGKKYIGQFLNDRYFSGTIFSVLVYNRALSPDRVRWLYHEPYAMIRPAGPARRYFTVSDLNSVFGLSEQGDRYHLDELEPRYAMKEIGPTW